MTSFVDDIRFSLRSLLRSRGFSLTAVLVLGLAIGLNAAVFSVINALLFKPLGGPADGELVGVYLRELQPRGLATGSADTGAERYRRFSYGEYDALRRNPGQLSSILAHEVTSAGLTDGESPRRAFVALVSANYFATLGVRPALGRDFAADEERNGGVAIVSHRYWQTLGAQRRLGGTVRVNGREVAIVGVAPAGFTGAMALFSPDLWLPLGGCAILAHEGRNAGAGCLDSTERRTLALVGRLPAGVGRRAATESLTGTAAQLLPVDAAAAAVSVGPLSRLSIGAGPSGDSEVALVLLFLASLAACVLLIAGVNLANMLLARGTARRRELAVRTALGGTRWRLLRLLATESALLASAGGAVGLALATSATRLIATAITGALPFAITFDATPDASVVAATLAFALAGGVACGLGPAVGLARRDSLPHLKDHAGHGRDGVGPMSVRNVLVVVQLAVSLALLTAAAIFVRGAFAASKVDAGFVPDRQLVASISPELSGYDDTTGRQAYDRILADLRAHPMVASAGLGSHIPFGMEAEGVSVRDARTDPSSDSPGALVSLVSADYFRTLGVRVLRGREFDAREERAPSPTRPAIVDHALASRLWPGRDPLGQRLQFRRGESWEPPAEIVGVVAPVREAPFDREPPARVYLPAGQEYRGQAYLHVRLRSAGDEGTAIRSVRAALRSSDASLAVLSIQTMRGHQDRSIYLWVARASAGLFLLFGMAALLLAVLGVYGVKSYLVSQRRKEIAIRMALGATPRQVLGRIVGDGAAITAAGLACGVLASVALADMLGGWVAGTGGFPWLPFAGAAALLASTTLVACWLPVRRATRSAPWAALRAQ